MFLGGWQLPFGIDPTNGSEPVRVLGKISVFVFLFV